MANVIKAKHEILNQGGNEGATKHIEKIGRVCYKSEEKICDGSDVKFVNMLCFYFDFEYGVYLEILILSMCDKEVRRQPLRASPPFRGKF